MQERKATCIRSPLIHQDVEPTSVEGAEPWRMIVPLFLASGGETLAKFASSSVTTPLRTPSFLWLWPTHFLGLLSIRMSAMPTIPSRRLDALIPRFAIQDANGLEMMMATGFEKPTATPWKGSGLAYVTSFALFAVFINAILLNQYLRQNKGKQELSSKLGFQLSHWKSIKQESSRWLLSRYYRS